MSKSMDDSDLSRDQKLFLQVKQKLTQLLQDQNPLKSQDSQQTKQGESFTQEEEEKEVSQQSDDKKGGEGSVLREIKELLERLDLSKQEGSKVGEKKEVMKNSKIEEEEKSGRGAFSQSLNESDLIKRQNQEIIQQCGRDLERLEQSQVNQYDGNKINEIIQEHSNNLILQYLHKRQNLIYRKFQDYDATKGVQFKEMKTQTAQLQEQVKQSLTQVIKYRLPVIRYREQPSARQEESKEMKKKEKEERKSKEREKKQFFNSFQEGQLLVNHKPDEICWVVCQINIPAPILSIGQAIVDDQDTFVIKGVDNQLTFIDLENFNCIQTLELGSKANVRWLIQIGEQIIIQLDNPNSEILFFHNFTFQKKWAYKEELIKPLIYYQDSEIFVVFASLTAELKLYEYKNAGFDLKNSLQLKSDKQEDSMDLSMMSKATILFMKDLPLSQMIAVGKKDGGITIVSLDIQSQTLSVVHSFLENHSVKDCVELKKDLILVIDYSPTDYSIIDLAGKKVTNLQGGGFGLYGLALTLFENYDINNYPYVLCKEQGTISILDPINNRMSQITENKQFLVADLNNLSEDTIFFDRNHPNIFFTSRYEKGVRSNYSVFKYEINPLLMEQFKLNDQ